MKRKILKRFNVIPADSPVVRTLVILRCRKFFVVPLAATHVRQSNILFRGGLRTSVLIINRQLQLAPVAMHPIDNAMPQNTSRAHDFILRNERRWNYNLRRMTCAFVSIESQYSRLRRSPRTERAKWMCCATLRFDEWISIQATGGEARDSRNTDNPTAPLIICWRAVMQNFRYTLMFLREKIQGDSLIKFRGNRGIRRRHCETFISPLLPRGYIWRLFEIKKQKKRKTERGRRRCNAPLGYIIARRNLKY